MRTMLKKIKKTKFFPVLNKGIKDSLGYPSSTSEFEVQAYIFSELKDKGYDIRGEVSTKRRKCQFDLVVYHKHLPRIVIEVKKQKKTYKHEKYVRFAQACKYDRYCTQVFYVSGMKEAKKFVNKSLAMRNKFFDYFDNLKQITEQGE